MQNPLLPEYAPAGHFYSPIPAKADVERAVARCKNAAPLMGIDLRENEQLALLNRLAIYYSDIDFPEKKNDRFRFAFENPSYSWCDAIILFCMIREIRPQKIIEVGSGHTSGLILDTNDRHFHGKISCTFVEPHPELLLSLLRRDELDRIEVIATPLQDMDPNKFEALGTGDILFIDSSHVVKAGSDGQALFFDVLPRLKRGVIVHFHDVFEQFEYPSDWLLEGRVWSEQYVLRAFLQFNTAFCIKLFTPHMISKYRTWFEQHMPNCFRNTGGHIWIERVR